MNTRGIAHVLAYNVTTKAAFFNNPVGVKSHEFTQGNPISVGPTEVTGPHSKY